MTARPQFPSISLEEVREVTSMIQNLPRLAEYEMKIAQEAWRGLAGVSKSMETITPILRQYAEAVWVGVGSIAPLLQRGFLNQHWVEAARTTVRFMEYSKKTVEEAGQILTELGWWIHPDWDLPSLRNIIKMHREGKEEKVEASILGYFDDEKLDSMVNAWKSNPLLKRRMLVLEDAVWAHKQGKYTLSIPALLPQIEGFVIESSGKKGKVQPSEIKGLLKKQLQEELVAGYFSCVLSTSVLKIIGNLVDSHFEWGQASKPKPGRHSILHGFFVDYSSKGLSLKLILLIDYLQNVLRTNSQQIGRTAGRC